MVKNQNSVVVPRIRPKFWWMIPMGAMDNHIKYEPETQRRRPGKAAASGGPRFPFLGQNSTITNSNGQMKGKGGYTPCAA